jgi:hypothetical protein
VPRSGSVVGSFSRGAFRQPSQPAVATPQAHTIKTLTSPKQSGRSCPPVTDAIGPTGRVGDAVVADCGLAPRCAQRVRRVCRVGSGCSGADASSAGNAQILVGSWSCLPLPPSLPS